jgi:hypothetical protein
MLDNCLDFLHATPLEISSASGRDESRAFPFRLSRSRDKAPLGAPAEAALTECNRSLMLFAMSVEAVN